MNVGHLSDAEDEMEKNDINRQVKGRNSILLKRIMWWLKIAFYRLQLLCSDTHIYMQYHISMQLLHRCYSRHLPRSEHPTMMLLLNEFSRLKNQFIQNKHPNHSKMCTRKMGNTSNWNITYFIVFSNDKSISPMIQTYLYITSFTKIWSTSHTDEFKT